MSIIYGIRLASIGAKSMWAMPANVRSQSDIERGLTRVWWTSTAAAAEKFDSELSAHIWAELHLAHHNYEIAIIPPWSMPSPEGGTPAVVRRAA